MRRILNKLRFLMHNAVVEQRILTIHLERWNPATIFNVRRCNYSNFIEFHDALWHFIIHLIES